MKLKNTRDNLLLAHLRGQLYNEMGVEITCKLSDLLNYRLGPIVHLNLWNVLCLQLDAGLNNEVKER